MDPAKGCSSPLKIFSQFTTSRTPVPERHQACFGVVAMAMHCVFAVVLWGGLAFGCLSASAAGSDVGSALIPLLVGADGAIQEYRDAISRIEGTESLDGIRRLQVLH